MRTGVLHNPDYHQLPVYEAKRRKCMHLFRGCGKLRCANTVTVVVRPRAGIRRDRVCTERLQRQSSRLPPEDAANLFNVTGSYYGNDPSRPSTHGTEVETALGATDHSSHDESEEWLE